MTAQSIIITDEPSVFSPTRCKPLVSGRTGEGPAVHAFSGAPQMTQAEVSKALDYVIWRIETKTDPYELEMLAIIREALESRIEVSSHG